MVAAKRKPFQGILNILHFNWHFYAAALALSILLVIIKQNTNIALPINIALWIIAYTFAVSLFVSCLVYDFSGFYKLGWIDGLKLDHPKKIVNINAGFDEMSGLLYDKFPGCDIAVLDFYKPEKHTEVSIKRARKKYPAYPGTIAIETTVIPYESDSADAIFLIFAAHEIRSFNESLGFFKELERILKDDGKIVMVEHLRDAPNLLAYSMGVFHFFPKSRWKSLASNSGLEIISEKKLTPFTTLFTIKKYGNPS